MAGTAAPLRLAITTGEPAGIGPDITLQALLAEMEAPGSAHHACTYTVIGDRTLLAERAALLGIAPAWQRALDSGRVAIAHVPLGVPCIPGQLDTQNGAYVLAVLDEAIDGCQHGRYQGMVTAPLQKSVIADTGIAFTGHTEYLAERTGTPHVVMMLAGPQPAHANAMLRVALATTHLPLRAVADAITTPLLVDALHIIAHDLRRRFGLPKPRILMTGLNPHAGEQGHLGREEIDVIIPALQQAVADGLDVRGPYPADTLFQPRYLQDADCMLAMYHDQGLAPLKYGTFGHGINVTLGLPLIRTSVDHGTALDLAGTGRAEYGSMRAALQAAVDMARCELSARDATA
ncbi:4-hydroxythreonine-4-phosphate dehydrogenase PdxA [Imbroritus primus]|uniref:4-hydroxythreonine-4-phosphate dehydrogenase PdxA n=1 Tax=Imbroritus primus TaxID=3058603 RepID=UPI003D161C1D